MKTCAGPTCQHEVAGRADRKWHSERCRHDARLWASLWGRYAEAGRAVARSSREARAARRTA